MNALLLAKLTDDDDGAVSINDPNAMKLLFWASIAASLLLYFVADRVTARKQARVAEQKANQPVAPVGWRLPDYARAAIPAAAYVAWVMLQKPSTFDSVFPSVSEGTRWVVAVFAALVLGAMAKLLTDRADGEDPPAPGGDGGGGGGEVVDPPPDKVEPESPAPLPPTTFSKVIQVE